MPDATCYCGTEVLKVDGRLWEPHSRQRHFAALAVARKKAGRKAKPRRAPTAKEMTARDHALADLVAMGYPEGQAESWLGAVDPRLSVDEQVIGALTEKGKVT